MKKAFYEEPFLILKSENSDKINFYNGDIFFCENLNEAKEICEKTNSVILLPFSSANDKYEDINLKSEAKIIVMKIKEKNEINIDFLCEFANENFEISNVKFHNSDEEYINSVKNVIEKEIKNGEGSNFTIARKLTGRVENFSVKKVLSLFCKLIQNEIGAYQTFCFFTGDLFLTGATPECHINISENKVRMQPISGTYRKKNLDINEEKKLFLQFLKDKKEINELFMTVDEELKMMAKICSSGGKIIGPRLREMSKVIHTEYLLTGESKMNFFDIIKESMHAATVVGSPLKNAFVIGNKYNNFDRRYYGGLIGIFNLEKNSFDSSILIRTAEIDIDGNFEVSAGASIVEDSNPEIELQEVNAKLNGLISNFNSVLIQNNKKLMEYFKFDHEINEELYNRNQNLSRFWFFDNSNSEDLRFNNFFSEKKMIIINNEDDFTNMLKHIFNKIGFKTEIVKYNDYKYSSEFDLVLIGPGPGDPNNSENEKIKKITKITENLLNSKSKILGICLGHQILSKVTGLRIEKAKEVTQGVQKIINLFGKKRIVGFYNTFYAKYDSKIEKERNLQIEYDKNTNDIYAIRGKNFSSMQFHPESLLTQNGFEIILNELKILFNLHYES